jgi:hypothetical protein
MGMRPMQAKGPYVGSAGASGGTPVTPTTVPTWFNFTVTYLNLAAANMNSVNAYILYSLPLRGVIQATKVRVTTPFTGPGLTAYAVAMGFSVVPDELGAYYDVRTAPGFSDCQLTPVLATLDQTGGASSVYMNAQSLGANLNAATAGSLVASLLVSLPS